MVTLIKYGALGGGEKYNVNQMWIDGLSTDAKPTATIDGMPIPNGSVFTEVDTGKTYMFDKDNTTWYEVSLGGGGGGGGGFTPTTAQLDAMNSGITSEGVQQISANETNILSVKKKHIAENISGYTEDLNEINWEQKIPQSGTGIPADSSTRICTELVLIPANTKTVTITFNDTTHKIALYTYDKNGDTCRRMYWFTTSPLTMIFTEKETQYILGLALKTNGTITPSGKTAVTNISYVSTITPYYVFGSNDKIEFELGTLAPESGAELTSTTRLRSDYIYLPKGSRIVNYTDIDGERGENDSKDGLLVVYEFNTDKSYRSDSSWSCLPYTMSDDGYCRILIRKTLLNGTISPEDIPLLKAQVVIEPAYPIGAYNEIMLSQYIPAYYDVDTAITSINTNAESVGVNGITLAFATDIHWENDTHRAGEIIKGLNDKNCDIDYLLLGGDFINGGTKSTAIKNIKAAVDSFYSAGFETLCLRGNHDDNSIPSGNTLISDAEFYSICQSKMPNGVVYGDYAYFYYDDTKSKTRFICLDSGVEGSVLSTAQSNWLSSALASTPEGWHIIVAWHIIYGLASGTWNDVPLDLAPTAFSTAVFTILDNHNSGGTSNVEVIIGGHCHCDKNDATSGGIPIVLTDTASLKPLNGGSATRNTNSETAVDVITVDYTNKTINCVRIGRGSNRIINY